MGVFGHKVLLMVAVAALVFGAAFGQCANNGNNWVPGLFTNQVNWGCEAPFNCLLEFCGCVSDELSTGCLSGAFNLTGVNVTAAVLQECTAALATCTLNAALAAPGATNHSCRRWGQSLAYQYEQTYANRSLTNLTDMCTADYCSVVGGVPAVSASAVNVSYVCSLVNFSWPEPLTSGVFPQCVATMTSRTYFNDLPLAQCSDAATCATTFCTCMGGVMNTTTYDCKMPSNLTATIGRTCLTSALSCLVSAALSAYVPGASPLDSNPCVAWSVPVAEDYAAYYAAATKRNTMLYRTCNFTACQDILGELDSTDFATVCDLPATVQPTFTAYNPCPYSCPDGTCAASLATCACTANAAVSALQSVLTPALNGTMDISKAFAASAYASYGVASGNCSTYDFTSALKFSWRVLAANGSSVVAVNSSTLSIAAGRLTSGVTYTLVLQASGLISSQSVTQRWTFTATLPPPTVTIRNGLTVRAGLSSNITLKTSIVDFDTSVATSSWTCTANSGTCPTFVNATSSSAIIPAGSVAGEYVITFTYRSANASVTVTLVSGEVPVVTVFASTTGISASPATFLSTQTIVIGSAVTFSTRNFTYAWTLGSNTTVISTAATLTLTAADLTSTTIANAVAGTVTGNTVTLTVTPVADTTVFGQATMSVAILEPLSMGLTVAKQGGGASATALSDTLILTPTVTGLGNSVPFSATKAVRLYFFDNVSSVTTRVSLKTTPSGAAYTATAPVFGFSGSSVSLTFGAAVTLNGITAASGNATFTIAAVADKAAAAANLLTSLSSSTDPAAVAAAVSTLRALAASSGNATLASELAASAVDKLASTSVADLPADEAADMIGSMGDMLGSMSASSVAASSAKVSSMLETLVSADGLSNDQILAAAKAAEKLPGKSGASVGVAIAAASAKNVEVGSSVSVTQTGMDMKAEATTGADMENAEFGGQSSCSASARLPTGFVLPGVSATDKVTVVMTKTTASPYATVDPAGSTTTMDILVNGKIFDVTGLDVPIEITLGCDAGSGSCSSNTKAAPTWKTVDPDVKTEIRNGRTVCIVKHLTSFALTGSSSASAAAVSLLVMLAAVVVQLVLA